MRNEESALPACTVFVLEADANCPKKVLCRLEYGVNRHLIQQHPTESPCQLGQRVTKRLAQLSQRGLTLHEGVLSFGARSSLKLRTALAANFLDALPRHRGAFRPGGHLLLSFPEHHSQAEALQLAELLMPHLVGTGKRLSLTFRRHPEREPESTEPESECGGVVAA